VKKVLLLRLKLQLLLMYHHSVSQWIEDTEALNVIQQHVKAN
jgi:hypothetical protein